jgi:preprotein translocase subunit SecE
VAETANGGKKKRRVKNPETFRERATKATEAGDKPAAAKRLRQVSGQVAKPMVGPVRRSLSRFFTSKPLQPVTKVLRFIGKIIFPSYFRKSWQELKLVTWPGWKESRRLTSAVLIFAIIFGATIALVDWGLDKIFRQLLIK